MQYPTHGNLGFFVICQWHVSVRGIFRVEATQACKCAVPCPWKFWFFEDDSGMFPFSKDSKSCSVRGCQCLIV